MKYNTVTRRKKNALYQLIERRKGITVINKRIQLSTFVAEYRCSAGVSITVFSLYARSRKFGGIESSEKLRGKVRVPQVVELVRARDATSDSVSSHFVRNW